MDAVAGRLSGQGGERKAPAPRTSGPPDPAWRTAGSAYSVCMGEVHFEVRHEFRAPARAVWDALVDWDGHGDWVPSTRMVVDPGDPTQVGATFTAYSGVGPLVLEDRMRVEECEWDEDSSRGACEVAKLGPVLTGRAGFTVAPDGDGAVVEWFERVEVPRLPQSTAPIAARIGAVGFKRAMRNLAKLLDPPA